MTSKTNKKVPGLFFILPGIILIVIRFIGENDNWSIIDIVKLAFGGLMIIYGIYVSLNK
jgi:hypothetical protein